MRLSSAWSQDAIGWYRSLWAIHCDRVAHCNAKPPADRKAKQSCDAQAEALVALERLKSAFPHIASSQSVSTNWARPLGSAVTCSSVTTRNTPGIQVQSIQHAKTCKRRTTCSVHHAACNMQRVASCIQYVASSMRHATYNI